MNKEIAQAIAYKLALDNVDYRGDTGVSKMFAGYKNGHKIDIKYTSGKIFNKDENNRWVPVKNFFIEEVK